MKADGNVIRECIRILVNAIALACGAQSRHISPKQSDDINLPLATTQNDCQLLPQSPSLRANTNVNVSFY